VLDGGDIYTDNLIFMVGIIFLTTLYGILK